jgi:hypothetical protein
MITRDFHGLFRDTEKPKTGNGGQLDFWKSKMRVKKLCRISDLSVVDHRVRSCANGARVRSVIGKTFNLHVSCLFTTKDFQSLTPQMILCLRTGRVKVALFAISGRG